MPVQEAKERYVRAQAAAEACIRHLKEQFHVKEVHSCGSLAQEGPFHPRSDIDLVVEGLVPGDYFEALRVYGSCCRRIWNWISFGWRMLHRD